MNKKVISCLFLFGLIFCTVFSSKFVIASVSEYSYNGTVSKISDYESGNETKEDASEKATNRVTQKPSGTFVSWVEVNASGSNATAKKSYTKTGTYYMNYVKNIDDDDSCASNLYRNQYKLHLNISTSLSNFTSGTVKGYWSPDEY